MKALRTFLTWSGAFWWVLILALVGYFWQGGYFYARHAPLFDALMCAESATPHFPLDGSGGPYLPPSCLRGIYSRVSAEDIATANSEPKYLDAVLRLPEDGATEKVLDLWLAHGANINIQSKLTGATLLEMYAKSSDVDTVDLLIKHGAKIDLRNKAGQTPLEALRAYDENFGHKPNEEIVKLLGG